ncbi:hypothetical protein AMJ52_02395 [candidate division TA06 bacterium DG_78]|uniref:DUF3788 domain-containing protein n=1 Tax=candidate division TA06 bacterium DG_78 TaxID=1703772 RepID=A0A0S7YGR1_UNCT6|nr:MAG: hypothetical protein AMJ52_02395 [candidate division TA06 bacterium DG_78]
MLTVIGTKAALWSEFRTYLATHYDHEPNLSIGKKEHDWTIRYRKSGKTLVTLSPEKNGFCVLVVLGKDEVTRAVEADLNPYVKHIFETAKQYHDGRWLWIRPRNKKDIESIKTLLRVKKRPKMTSEK